MYCIYVFIICSKCISAFEESRPIEGCHQILFQAGTVFSQNRKYIFRKKKKNNDDYDNGMSDNCDHNFGTFDDFGVKDDQKVSHNMILMSKYKGQHCGKKG